MTYKILVHTEPDDQNIKYWEVYRESGQDFSTESLYEANDKYASLAMSNSIEDLMLISPVEVKAEFHAYN
jgi:hypothetical protein